MIDINCTPHRISKFLLRLYFDPYECIMYSYLLWHEKEHPGNPPSYMRDAYKNSDSHAKMIEVLNLNITMCYVWQDT
jgi:hypothetical protein